MRSVIISCEFRYSQWPLYVMDTLGSRQGPHDSRGLQIKKIGPNALLCPGASNGLNPPNTVLESLVTRRRGSQVTPAQSSSARVKTLVVMPGDNNVWCF